MFNRRRRRKRVGECFAHIKIVHNLLENEYDILKYWKCLKIIEYIKYYISSGRNMTSPIKILACTSLTKIVLRKMVFNEDDTIKAVKIFIQFLLENITARNMEIAVKYAFDVLYLIYWSYIIVPEKEINIMSDIFGYYKLIHNTVYYDNDKYIQLYFEINTLLKTAPDIYFILQLLKEGKRERKKCKCSIKIYMF